MLEISIIIPVYNAESYIERCLQSITTSVVPEGSYEIIAVDDSSSDGSLLLLQKLEEELPQLHVYHRRRSGPGGARNLGMNYAKGRYIMFVDADDYINTDSFSRLVSLLISQYDQDIIGFDYLKVDTDGNEKPYSNQLFPYCREMTGAEYMNMQQPLGVLWGYLFNRKFILKNNLKFQEKIAHSDEDFVSRVFCVAETVTFLPVLIYYYCYNSESIINKSGEGLEENRFYDNMKVIDGLDVYSRELSGSFVGSGLDRKINYLVVDVIRLLVRKRMEDDFIMMCLAFFTEISRYSLPDCRYNWKYSVFRIITLTPKRVLWWKRHADTPLIRKAIAKIF
ncbi:glycosyltransferase [Coprobacter sp.]